MEYQGASDVAIVIHHPAVKKRSSMIVKITRNSEIWCQGTPDIFKSLLTYGQIFTPLI